MLAQLRKLNKLVYFESVARHSSISLAAQELSVSAPAVSQHIQSLEEEMGVSLFRRVKGRLVITEKGSILLHSVSKALVLLNEVRNQVGLTTDYDSLVVRVPFSFGVIWLGDLLNQYIAQNEAVNLHVNASSEPTDFEKENVDFEIRYSLDTPDGLYLQALASDYVLPLCTPDIAQYAEKHGVMAALKSFKLIHTTRALVTWENWCAHQNLAKVDFDNGLRFDRSLMSVQAVKSGSGISLETATLTMKELRNGELVPLVKGLTPIVLKTYWIVCPFNHLNKKCVGSFIEWLTVQAQHHDSEKKRLLTIAGAVIK